MVKIQDLVFLVGFLVVFWRKSSQLAILFGLGCLLLAIPLFNLWIFFTAERLTWYGAAFFALAMILQLIRRGKG